MKLPLIRERLIRRLCTNYVAYMGQKDVDPNWLEGYFQAKKDAESFLRQQETFVPWDKE